MGCEFTAAGDVHVEVDLAAPPAASPETPGALPLDPLSAALRAYALTHVAGAVNGGVAAAGADAPPQPALADSPGAAAADVSSQPDGNSQPDVLAAFLADPPLVEEEGPAGSGAAAWDLEF